MAALERVRRTFELRVFGYVVMPEHVHLLLSEPQRGTLADAIKSRLQGASRGLIGEAGLLRSKGRSYCASRCEAGWLLAAGLSGYVPTFAAMKPRQGWGTQGVNKDLVSDKSK